MSLAGARSAQENTVGSLISVAPLTPLSSPYRTGYAEDSITVSWAPLPGYMNGGMIVTSYKLEMYDGSSWSTLKDDSSTSHQATGLNKGEDYQFRFSAKNVHGYSPVSPTITLKSAMKPAQVLSGSEMFSIYTGTDNKEIGLTWGTPSDRGATIDKYTIYISTSASTWTDAGSYCAESSPLSSPSCTIPMSTFWAAPFSLGAGVQISYKVKAHNQLGWSLVSDPFLGVNIQTIPAQPSPPSKNIPGTDSTHLHVDWTQLTTPQDGDSTILK